MATPSVATEKKEKKEDSKEGEVGGLSLDDVTGTLKLISKVNRYATTCHILLYTSSSLLLLLIYRIKKSLKWSANILLYRHW